MIKVIEQPEPASFFEKVQQPGEAFLRRCPKPTKRQWKVHSYWREVSEEMHKAYKGICAYYCQYIPCVTGADTVEHFEPKDKYPQKAYLWSNYRFVCNMMNGRKGLFEDVLDPFKIEDGWFALDFDTLFIVPGENVTDEIRVSVQRSIARLKLNDNKCVDGRLEVLRNFAKWGVEYLEFYAPFIAKELERQNIFDEISERFQEG